MEVTFSHFRPVCLITKSRANIYGVYALGGHRDATIYKFIAAMLLTFKVQVTFRQLDRGFSFRGMGSIPWQTF
jgi:hypothetical protein